MEYTIEYVNKPDTYLGELTFTGMRNPVTLQMCKPTEDISKAIKFSNEVFVDSLLTVLGKDFEKVEINDSIGS